MISIGGLRIIHKPTTMAKDNKKEMKPDVDIEVAELDGAKFTDFELNEKEKEALIAQVQKEYKVAHQTHESRLNTTLKYLKLYNNQKKKDSKVGDPLGFTIFQTVLAALYMDEMMVDFEAVSENDEVLMDNLRSIAESDYHEMDKNKLDYFQLWDALMYSQGIVDLSTFVKEVDGYEYNMPYPTLVDPATFLIDPTAPSINGDLLGNGRARFLGRLIAKTGYDCSEADGYMDVDRLVKARKATDSPLRLAQEMRLTARGDTTSFLDQYGGGLGTNDEHELLLWDTHFEFADSGVHKVRATLGNEQSLLVKFQVKEDKDNRWSYINKPFNPQSGSFWGTSIFDLVGDKQRLKAVLINLGLESLIEMLYPTAAYDKNKLKSKGDLNYKKRKFIPVDGRPGDVIAPVRSVSIDANYLSLMKDELDVSAQKATATPEMQQGVLNQGDKTKYELQSVNAGVDDRRSLSITHLLWAETDFWKRWYKMYDLFLGEDIDMKVVAIKGDNRTRYLKLTRKDIIGERYPKIIVKSKRMLDVKRRAELVDRLQVANFVFQDPTSDRRYYTKKLLDLIGMDNDEVDGILPPTADEMKAEKETELLSENKFVDAKTGFVVEVAPTDNHFVHLRIHARAKDTNSKAAHMNTHTEALQLMNTNPELFNHGEPKQGMQPGEVGGQPVVMPAGQRNSNLVGVGGMQ